MHASPHPSNVEQRLNAVITAFRAIGINVLKNPSTIVNGAGILEAVTTGTATARSSSYWIVKKDSLNDVTMLKTFSSGRSTKLGFQFV